MQSIKEVTGTAMENEISESLEDYRQRVADQIRQSAEDNPDALRPVGVDEKGRVVLDMGVLMKQATVSNVGSRAVRSVRGVRPRLYK